MPIYAFECFACGHAFDELMRLSDPDPTTCPSCGAPQVRRQLTAPQFRLSGGGWYETDFKKDGDRKRNLAGDGGGKPAEGTGTAASAPPPPKAEGASAPTKASEPAPAAKPAASASGT
ncbi:MAG: FmdB family zinc ribbon protein [Pseudomonadota bacterium]|jgi:putative FmdB family regulatory protein